MLYIQLLFSLLLSLIVNHSSLCMLAEETAPSNVIESGQSFSQLPAELHKKIFACSMNRNSWRAASKYWHTIGSINAPTVYDIACHNPFYAAEEDKTRIILSACYNKRHKVVKNILHNSDSKAFFYNIFPTMRWSLCVIGLHVIDDQKMVCLLKKNELTNFDNYIEEHLQGLNTSGKSPYLTITDLEMACFSGDANLVKECMSNDCGGEIKLPLHIAILLDNVNCLKVLLDHRNTTQSKINNYLNADLLYTALESKSKRCLQLLIDNNYFDLYKIPTGYRHFLILLRHISLQSIINNHCEKNNEQKNNQEINDMKIIVEEALSKNNEKELSGFLVQMGTLFVITGAAFTIAKLVRN